jgi:hypothetical protein
MSALEQHYRVNQLVKLWGLSRRTIIRLVDLHMLKVPKLGKSRSRFGPIKRSYTTRSVPQSLVEKIYRDLLPRASGQ